MQTQLSIIINLIMNTIKEWLDKNNIDEVECLIPDLAGNARGKLIPARKYLRSESLLPEALLLLTVNGVELDDHYELLEARSDRDVVAKPDADTICPVPWASPQEPTALLIHDCCTRDGQLHPLASRSVLRKVLALYEAKGWRPVVAPEAEFYFVKTNTNPDEPLVTPIGRNGRREQPGQSYSVDAVNQYERIIDDIYEYCEAMGLDVETLTHEEGPAQFEINFVHGDALTMADQMFLFKRTVRETALQHNIYATFMAKPMQDAPGSSMHIHQSIVDAGSGRNIFTDANNGESALFRHYIGGLQKYTPEFLAMYAPNVNSYRRLLQVGDAPANVCWGYDNRSVGLRVPISDPLNLRVENRFPGTDSNPYLALAASLASGYLGMEQQLEPDEPVDTYAVSKQSRVSTDFAQALESFATSSMASEVFGESFVRAYCAVKKAEYASYLNVVSSWEREFLLLNV